MNKIKSPPGEKAEDWHTSSEERPTSPLNNHSSHVEKEELSQRKRNGKLS